MSEEMEAKVGLSLEKGMIFKCDLGDINIKDLYIDEEHNKEKDMIGPNPSRLLGLAILGCLSASFAFCLKKKEFEMEDLKAEADVVIKRNDKGFWRVKEINVNIKSKINDPDAKKRAEQCKKMFEQFCIVTQAVREGIDVNVDLSF